MLFRAGIVEDLPDVYPRASIALATMLMSDMSVGVRPEVSMWTVRNIVLEMKKFLCMFAWKVSSAGGDVVAESASEVVKVLQTAIIDENIKSSTKSSTDAFRDDVKPDHKVSQEGNTKGLSSATSLPLKDIVQLLKDELGITKSGVSEVIQEVIETMADSTIAETCNELPNFKAKVVYLAEVVGVALPS